MSTNPVFSQKVKLLGVILTKENLCRLISALSKYYSRNKITVYFKNGLIIDGLSIETFRDYNFKNEKLERIEVRGRDENFDSSYSIRKNFDEFYEIEFSHREKDTHVLIENEVKYWIQKEENKRFLRLFFNNWSSTLFFGLIIEITYLIAVWKTDVPYDNKMNLSISLFSLPFFIGWFIKLFVKRLFPITEIDIGINNAKKYRGVVWGIVTLIIIPLLLSIFF